MLRVLSSKETSMVERVVHSTQRRGPTSLEADIIESKSRIRILQSGPVDNVLLSDELLLELLFDMLFVFGAVVAFTLVIKDTLCFCLCFQLC